MWCCESTNMSSICHHGMSFIRVGACTKLLWWSEKLKHIFQHATISAFENYYFDKAVLLQTRGQNYALGTLMKVFFCCVCRFTVIQVYKKDIFYTLIIKVSRRGDYHRYLDFSSYSLGKIMSHYSLLCFQL